MWTNLVSEVAAAALAVPREVYWPELVEHRYAI